MAKFDVYPLRRRAGFVVDCQSDLNSAMDTRIVIPLLPASVLIPLNKRINPTFTIDGRDHVLAVQGMQTVPVRALGQSVMSLLDRGSEIIGAIDTLISGI